GWRLARPLEELHLGVPDRLRELIEAEVDHLAAEEQRVLEVASVAGAEFSASVIAAPELTLETAEDVCNRLASRSHLIRATGFRQFSDGTVSSRYQFAHALYRDVLYDRLGPARRARLHLRIGERLEALSQDDRSAIASELADHFEQGSDWTRTVEYLRLAADASRRRLAQREAMAILRRALGLVHHLPEAERAANEVGILETLATDSILVTDIDEYETILETYHALTDRAAHYGFVDVEVRALVEQAWPMSWTNSQPALDALERALRLGDRQTERMRTRTRASCACWRGWGGGWGTGPAGEGGRGVCEG